MLLRLNLVACVLTLLCLGGSQLQAQDKISFDQQLPTNTYAYFRISDVEQLKTKFQKTVYWKIFKDPEMKPFLSQFEEKAGSSWAEASAKLEEQLGVTLKDLLNIPSGEIGVAVFTPPRKDIALGVKIHYGDKESLLKTIFKKVNEQLLEDGNEIKNVDVAGVSLTTVKFVDSEEPNFIYGMKDKNLMMTSSMAAMEAMLERWDGKQERTFSASTNRLAIVDSLKTPGETALIEWFVNPIDLARVGAKYSGEAAVGVNMAMGFLPIIGLDQLKAIGGYIDLATDQLDAVERTQLVIDTPLRGIMNMFVFPDNSHTPPKYVKDDALSFDALDWDIKSAYSAVETVFDSFQGPGAFEAQIEQLSKTPAANGIHIKKDIFDNFNGKFMLTTHDGPEDSKAPLIMFATLGFNDQKVAKGFLEKIASMDGSNVSATEVEGQYALEFPDDMFGDEESSFVKYLVLGKNEYVLIHNKEQFKDYMSGTTTKGLAENANFKKLRSMIPEMVSLLSVDLLPGKAMEQAYTSIKENGIGDSLDQIPSDELRDFLEGIDFSKLPDYKTLIKYYPGTANYSKTNSKGSSLNMILLKN